MNVIQQQAGEIAELTDGDSGVQQPTPTTVATIHLTASKYGLLDGSVHEVAGVTESGLYYALRGTSSSVLIEHEGRYWEWQQRGPIPTGIQYRRERSVSNSSSTSGTSSSSGKRKIEDIEEKNPLDRVAKDIGRRMLDVAGSDPEAYRDLMDMLKAAELKKAAATAGLRSSVPRPASVPKYVPDGLRAKTAAHEEIATCPEVTKGKEAAMSTSMSTMSADRSGAAGTTADRVAHNDHLGWRAYESPWEASRQPFDRKPARQTTVFDRLGPVGSSGQTRM